MTFFFAAWWGWLPALVVAAGAAIVLASRGCKLRYHLLVTLAVPILWLILYQLARAAAEESSPRPVFDAGDSSLLTGIAFALLVNTGASIAIAAVALVSLGIAAVVRRRRFS